MRTLVTGASGFIGSYLCRELCAQGHEVIALHRPTSLLAGLEGLPVQRVLGDILDPGSLARVFDGVEVAFHTAAPMRPEADGRTAIEAHVLGTRHVLQAARRAGVRRLIHTSSVAALGVPDVPPSVSAKDAPLLDERHAWNYLPERWPYAFAEYSSELEVQRAVEDGLQAVIVNPSAVFGAGDWYRTSKSLVAHLGRGALTPVIAGGLNAVHIDDVVAGHLAAVERGRTGERYILGGENLTLPDMFRITAQVVGRRPPRLRIPLWAVPAVRRLLQPARAILRLPIEPSLLWLAVYYFFYDTRKSQIELGLPPAKPYRQAAQDTYAWLLSIGAVPSSRGGDRLV
ncbi:MAG: NAD-dependent epimerase/dehydratase family protein [Planctomycetes bacterium]|nr:NAD-dependent epimerase/dehydratase family protein [Planctomycetota bacterium]